MSKPKKQPKHHTITWANGTKIKMPTDPPGGQNNGNSADALRIGYNISDMSDEEIRVRVKEWADAMNKA